jgi:hypothetical protein
MVKFFYNSMTVRWLLANAFMAGGTLGRLQVGRQATFFVDWPKGLVGRLVYQKHTLIDS